MRKVAICVAIGYCAALLYTLITLDKEARAIVLGFTLGVFTLTVSWVLFTRLMKAVSPKPLPPRLEPPQEYPRFIIIEGTRPPKIEPVIWGERE